MAVNRSKFTTTLMLVGIPNAGKSAIANSLHQIGRISATEKGKLKNATVSPLPGETKDICSFKIGSHPNIYVLDTPGVLSPDIPDYEMALKLALTGAFDDCLFGEENLARHFLAIVSLSDVYKKWETMASEDIKSTMEYKRKPSDRSEVYKKRRKIGYTDHTQDYIVRDVRRTLFETISSFKGNLEDDNEKARLIEDQLLALREAFRVPLESGEDGCQIVAKKLLDLYRTGRLGQYTLDSISCNSQ